MSGKEEIPIYDSTDFVLLDELDGDGCEDIRNKQGFHRVNCFKPYFIEAVDWGEIYIYRRSDLTLPYLEICELWDGQGCVFMFASLSSQKTMKIVQHYLDIIQKSCSIEFNIKSLQNEVSSC